MEEKQKVNGQVLEEEFFQGSESPKTESKELDLDEYRAGKPLELTEILETESLPRVAVRKPRGEEWFRCANLDLERVWLYESGRLGETYLVIRSVALELPEDCFEAYLALCINLAGRLFLWPIKCSGGDFADDALRHAAIAKAEWIRRKWDNTRGRHRIKFNTQDAAPEWPKEINIREIISRAFTDRVIRSIEHPCLKFARSVKPEV
jgi:hypothetical protein